VYCQSCGKDGTRIVQYDDDSSWLAYGCDCGHAGEAVLAEQSIGKLVWKVDWPMRWAYEGVSFEAGGVDHSSPGSSFTVGRTLVEEVFGGRPPVYLGYSFVGTKGAAKMSGSVGGAPTPADALDILEPSLARWVYVRRRPSQAITISFDQDVNRLYDEWDGLAARVGSGSAAEAEQVTFARSVGIADGRLPQTARPFPFRMLAAVTDVTANNEAQMARILSSVSRDAPLANLDDARPRLDCARNWITKHVPPSERTHVRAEPDQDLLASLNDTEREALKLLADGLGGSPSLDEMTTLVYGVPKLQLGLTLDAAPSPELKVAQREFFALVYRLLVGRDTGPRLPTLLLSLEVGTARHLLGV
jgi:lysyl-tRNA synthetase class 1